MNLTMPPALQDTVEHHHHHHYKSAILNPNLDLSTQSREESQLTEETLRTMVEHAVMVKYLRKKAKKHVKRAKH
jgi:hypothetical protein